MLEEIKEVIDIVKILKEEYNYTFTGDLEDFMKQDFIEFEGNGIDAFFWFYYKGEKYLFKAIDNPEYNSWGEIIAGELATHLGIPHAEYRIAEFGDKKGVISKCLIKGSEKIISGSEFFQQFYNEYLYNSKGVQRKSFKEFCENYEISEYLLELKPYDRQRYVFNYLNNVDCISSILQTLSTDEYKKIFSSDEITSITVDLVTLLVFDLITLQYDRHPSNWGIIKSNGYRLCPLYDNSTSFGLNYPNINERIVEFPSKLMGVQKAAMLSQMDETEYKDSIIYDQTPTLTVDTTDSVNPLKKKKKTIPEILDHLLRITESNMCNEITNTILSINSDLIEDLIKKGEEKNYKQMDENLKNYILILFDNHLERIHEIATRHRRIEHGNSK